MTTSPDILLPEPLPIDGLTFRPYAGESDIPGLVALHNTVNQADGSTEISSVEEERNELANTPNVDPRVDFMLGVVDDRVVAASTINWADTTQGQRHYRVLGQVHPEWRRRGIGATMLARNERRLRQLAADHDRRDAPVFVTWFDDGNIGGPALVAEQGYSQVRVYHHMVRPDMADIDLPPIAAGLELRPVTEDDLPRLWEALAEAFRDHYGGQDTSPEARRAWLEDPLRDTDLFAVAFDGDEIAGGVLGYIVPEENAQNGYLCGWTDPVFTRRAWRRRGLARALLGRCLVMLRDAGMTSAQLDVDTENPADALSLYRSHRFETDRGATEWQKPLALT